MNRAILAQIKSDNDEASEWLLYYLDRRTQFYRDKTEAWNSTVMPETPVHTGPGNPTLQKVMTLTRLLDTERWLETVEIVQDMLGEKKQVYLQIRREAAYIQNRQVRGRPAWVIYVQRHYADEMAKRYRGTPDKFWLSETTIKNWWSQMIELTARVAIKRGCL